MKPIFFTIDDELPVKIVPDTQMHLDGHPVITYNYNIFFDSARNDPAALLSGSEPTDNINGPDYMGTISFEEPGRIFSYTPGENRTLTRDEIEEIIEHLSEYRSKPDKWSKDQFGE